MTTTAQQGKVPLVEMRDMSVSFGGVHAVKDVSIDLYPGEILGLVGGNGAGKSTLIKTLSGAQKPDSGEIYINGEHVSITSPRDAKNLGIETIYQTLALAENQDAPSNMFLGRELMTRWGTLDDSSMEDAARKVMAIGGGVVLAATFVGLGLLWRREIRRPRAPGAAAAPGKPGTPGTSVTPGKHDTTLAGLQP